MTALALGDDAADITTIHVPLEGRAYDILIGPGLSAGAGRHVAGLASPGGRVAIVTDAHIAQLHLPAIEAGLKAAGLVASSIVIAPGEASKSYAGLAQVCDGILAAKVERGDLVLALGGGVVGDLAGFAAAVVRRGVRFVQMPTTLLAQVDSSVGGKTGINSAHGKNLVGAFHQPSLVIADTSLLDTLPAREMRAGYAEVVKYGLIGDASFFAWCETNFTRIFAEDGPARAHAVAVSCRAKAEIVVRDEHEHGDRALLNLGHTFGHALERITGYDGTRLVHGEAVAIGMALAFRFSASRGLCSADDAARVARHLAQAGLPTTLQAVQGGCGTPDDLVEAMFQDKKVSRGELTFILARGIGESFIAKGVPAAEVHAFLSRELDNL